MRTAIKRRLFLARAQAAEQAAARLYDPEAIELAGALVHRALELVDDLDDTGDDELLEEAATA